VLYFISCSVQYIEKKKLIQVHSTIVPLTELTWQRLDYMRYSKLKKNNQDVTSIRLTVQLQIEPGCVFFLLHLFSSRTGLIQNKINVS
jgi:hypothetical protein